MNADDPVATNPARHNNYPDVEDNHGKAGLNIVYCDGHAAWLPTRNPFAEWNLSFDDNRATFDDFYVSKSGYNSTVPRPFGYTGQRRRSASNGPAASGKSCSKANCRSPPPSPELGPTFPARRCPTH